MKYLLLLILFILPVIPALGEEKDCYVEETNCREEKVNCREEPTDCKEKCIQERCFDFIEEGKECMCIKKQKTDCKKTKKVCDKERVCDEKLICGESKASN